MNAELNQYANETELDWRYRLILTKAKRELPGVTWQDVADTLGLEYGGENLRKMGKGILAYDEYLKSRSACSADDTEEFVLRREKMRLQDQKRELNKNLREWARAEHIIEEIKGAIQESAAFRIPELPESTDGKGGQEAVLLLSDWHYGMVTNNATNTFNSKIFKDRLAELIKQTKERCRQHDIHKIHVMALGDLVHGIIHVTARVQSEEDVVRQSMHVAESIVQLLISLREEMNIELYWSRGNHDRIHANLKESIARESFADLILWYVKARIEGTDGITIHENKLDDEIIQAKICGHYVCAVHGHRDKPARAVRNMVAMTRILPDYVFLGHFHNSAEREIDGAEVIVNGSLCGTDDYAASLRLTGKPAQKLMVFSERGRECTYNLIL